MAPSIRVSAVLLTLLSLFRADASAGLDFTTSTFQNRTVVQNDATAFGVTVEIVEGGTVTGIMTATFTYGGGNNPFDTTTDFGTPSANALRIFGESSEDVAGPDTADGSWDFSIAPTAGYEVTGITLFSNGTVLGNPEFGITSDGTMTIFDGGNGNDLIAGFNDGDTLANGSTLDFFGGTHNNGILSTVHSRNWAVNAAGANTLSFKYRVGYDEPINGVAVEGLWLDVATTQSMPEPGAASLLGLATLLGAFYRRRRD